MTKTQIFFLIAVAVAIISSLIAINNNVMPYYAFIHSTQEIIVPTFPLTRHDAGNTVTIPGVDQVFMGWLDLLVFLLIFLIVFSLLGYVVGYRIRNSTINDDVEKEIEKRMSAKKVTAEGVTIGGYNAESIELTLRTEYRKLESKMKRFENDEKVFKKEKEDFEQTRKEAEEAVKQTATIKLDYANRLDKIARLEKTNEKLEKRIFELESEVLEFKRENLKLNTTILEHEKSK